MCNHNQSSSIFITGEWYIPEVTGTLPPPCAYHSLINIPGYKAMLTGGFSKNGRMSDLYELTLPTLDKTCVSIKLHRSLHFYSVCH